jgi:hypothetical protein
VNRGSRTAVLSQAGAGAPASASGASNGHGARRFSSASDDEVGGFRARSAATRIARRCLDERATDAFCSPPASRERVRKAAASGRNPQRAEGAIKRGASN